MLELVLVGLGNGRFLLEGVCFINVLNCLVWSSSNITKGSFNLSELISQTIPVEWKFQNYPARSVKS